MRCAKILLPVFLALGLTCSAVSAKSAESAMAEANKTGDQKAAHAQPVYDPNAVLWLESIRKQNLAEKKLEPIRGHNLPEPEVICPSTVNTALVRFDLYWREKTSGPLRLAGLKMRDCNLRGNFSANQHITSLTNLDIDNNAIFALNLAGLTGLKVLNAESNQITRITGLENSRQLEILSLKSNRISRIENLDKLTKLEELDLSNNFIDRIQGLENLKKLYMLNLSSNPITRLEGLANLTGLVALSCVDCALAEINGLDTLRLLSTLDLAGNRLEKIEGLAGLVNLQRLNLNQNLVSKLEGLDKLKNLAELEIQNNSLETLEGLEGLEKLEILNLNGNRLASLEGLPKKLKAVYLHNNSIPLSELYHASQTWKAANWFYGVQKNVFGNKELKTGHVYELTKEALIGGKETSFYVFHTATNSPAILGVEYQQNGGRFTFLKPGGYKISMFNPSLISQLAFRNHEDYCEASLYGFKCTENGAPARAVTGVISVRD